MKFAHGNGGFTLRLSSRKSLRSAGTFSLVRVMSSGMLLLAMATEALAIKPPPPETKSERLLDSSQKVMPLDRTINLGPQEKEPQPIPVDPNMPRPIIGCVEPVHDFGPVWVGPMLQHSFTLKNEGKLPLEISAVKPSCGCTIAGPYPKKIEPDQSGEFPFSVDSNKLHANFEKAVTITSNDPATPSLRLRLRGEVKRYVDVVPSSVQFGKLYGDQTQERLVKITGNGDAPLQLEITDKPEGNFEITLTPTTPGKAFDLKVVAKPPFEPGAFRKHVTLKTNMDAQKEVKLDLNGNVPERIELNPAILVIGSPGSGKATTGDNPLTRVVRFTNYGAGPVKILEAKCSDANVPVEVTEEAAGKVYSVNVKFPAQYAVPDGGATLTLKTDDAQKPTIEIPVKGWGPPPQEVAKMPPARPAEELVGQKAPEFSLTTTEGKSFATSDLQGKVTVIDFFANNCGFCKKQIPRLEQIRAEYQDKGVRFVTVSQTMRDKKFTDAETTDTLKQIGWRGELATDTDNKVGPLFRATSYPTMTLVGKGGVIEAVNLGNLGDLESRLKGQLDAMLAGKPVPKPEPLAQAPTPAQPEAPKPPPPPDPVGKPAPAFTLTTFDGKTLANGEFAASGATVLNFIAINCGFCKKQIPRLEKVREEYAAKGVRFVNVVETMRQPFTREQIEETMKGLGSKLEVAHDPDNKVGPLFSASGFPTMAVVGKTGKVEAVNVGNIGDLEDRLKGQLDAILAGKPVPQVAQAPTPAPPPPSLLGKPAPAIDLTTFDGKAVKNEEFAKGPATVLNFIATNCGYCKKQIPRVEKLRPEYVEKGVRFINVVETMRQSFSKEEISKVLSEVGSGLEVAQDSENKLGQPYNAMSFPTMVIVGKSGNIEGINVGNIEDLETRLKGVLDALVEGKPVPKFAEPPPPSSKRPAEELAGKPAPAISLSTIDGKSVSNDGFKAGPATVLNFFAPNCGFCKKQIPIVEAIRKEYESKGVRFINVAQKMRQDFTVEQMQEILKGVGSGMEFAASDFNSNAVGQAYKAGSYPTMFVVDREGKIANVNVGAKPDLDKLLKGQLDALIAGKAAGAPGGAGVDGKGGATPTP